MIKLIKKVDVRVILIIPAIIFSPFCVLGFVSRFAVGTFQSGWSGQSLMLQWLNNIARKQAMWK